MSKVTHRQFKICLLGDGYVGKTSIRQKYLDKTFKTNYIPTLGVDFAQKTIEYDGIPTNLVIWDVAGQPLYQSLRKRYYEGAHGIILAYSVVNRDSFNNTSKWLVEAHGYMKQLPPVIIVGNKIDLRGTMPQEDSVKTEEGYELAEKYSEKLGIPMIFIETSALTGEYIHEAFQTMTAMMVEKFTKKTSPAMQPKVTLPISTEPKGVTETIIRETEQVETPIVSTSSLSVVSVQASVGTPDGESHELPSELGLLREDLEVFEKERDGSIADLDTILLQINNEIHVKRIMHIQLKQQINLIESEWTAAVEKQREIEKTKNEELAKWNREIERIRNQIEELEEKK